MGEAELQHLLSEEPYVEHRGNPLEDYLWDIVGKNNQNTILLDRLFEVTIPNQHGAGQKHRILAIQSESRIFVFDCSSDRCNNSGQIGGSTQLEGDKKEEMDLLDKKKAQCQELLLKLYVAPLVRLLKIASNFFAVLDNLTFACMLLLLFFQGILAEGTQKKIIHILEERLYGNTALVVLMCSDILHNIMHASTRLWNLNRVDFPLVLVFYAAYFVTLTVDNIPEEGKKWDLSDSWVYFYALGFRFSVYYITESCEYWIDLLVLRILWKQSEHSNFVVPCYNALGFPYARMNGNDKEALKMFKGTYCSWNWMQSSVRFYKDCRRGKAMPLRACHHVCFYVGGLVAFVVVSILLGVVGLLVAFPYLLVRLMCCGSGIRDEIGMF